MNESIALDAPSTDGGVGVAMGRKAQCDIVSAVSRWLMIASEPITIAAGLILVSSHLQEEICRTRFTGMNPRLNFLL